MAAESIFVTAWRLNRALPLLVAALILLSVLAYAAVRYRAAPRFEALERRHIELQARVRQARLSDEESAEASSPQEIYQQGTEDLEVFRAAIPPRSAFTALIGEIYDHAATADLSIDRIAYQPEEIAESRLLQYSLSFSVGGSYDRIKKFIHALEQSERLIVIEELGLSGGTAEKGEVNLRVRLSTYFQEEPT